MDEQTFWVFLEYGQQMEKVELKKKKKKKKLQVVERENDE